MLGEALLELGVVVQALIKIQLLRLLHLIVHLLLLFRHLMAAGRTTGLSTGARG